MSTTPRQRVWQAIRHQQPDCVPWYVGSTLPARQKLEAYYGTADLDDVLGNHLARYKPRPPDAFREIRPGHWQDEFGVVWNRTVDKDIGVVAQYPLGRASLDGYEFPDPHDPRRYAALPEFAAAHPDRFRLAERVGRGGGLILAPSHDMPGDIPVENVVAFVEAMRSQ